MPVLSQMVPLCWGCLSRRGLAARLSAIPKFIDTSTSQAIDELSSCDSFEPSPDDSFDDGVGDV